jgi:hypothetical protein
VLCGAALVLVSTIVLLMCCQCVANELLMGMLCGAGLVSVSIDVLHHKSHTGG